MQLFNSRLLRERMQRFSFPAGGEFKKKINVIAKWQKSLRDSDLRKQKRFRYRACFSLNSSARYSATQRRPMERRNGT